MTSLVQALVLAPLQRKLSRQIFAEMFRGSTLRDSHFEAEIANVALTERDGAELVEVTVARTGIVVGIIDYTPGNEGLRDLTYAAGLGVDHVPVDRLAELIGKRFTLGIVRGRVIMPHAPALPDTGEATAEGE
jgi:hypothetical protein